MQNPDQAPWEGMNVYRVLPRRKRRPRYAIVSGWPTPVSERVRTKFPPLPGRKSYCIEARRWAKTQLKINQSKNKSRRPGGWLGPYTLRWLRAVAAGTRPLSYPEFVSLRRYWSPKPPPPPPRVQVRLNIPGWGLQRSR